MGRVMDGGWLSLFVRQGETVLRDADREAGGRGESGKGEGNGLSHDRQGEAGLERSMGEAG